jgi:hypothetical protein
MIGRPAASRYPHHAGKPSSGRSEETWSVTTPEPDLVGATAPNVEVTCRELRESQGSPGIFESRPLATGELRRIYCRLSSDRWKTRTEYGHRKRNLLGPDVPAGRFRDDRVDRRRLGRVIQVHHELDRRTGTTRTPSAQSSRRTSSSRGPSGDSYESHHVRGGTAVHHHVLPSLPPVLERHCAEQVVRTWTRRDQES